MKCPAAVWTTLLTVGLVGGSLCAGDQVAGGAANIDPADRQHWAFRSLSVPAVPASIDRAAVATPVDAFIEKRLSERGSSCRRRPIA